MLTYGFEEKVIMGIFQIYFSDYTILKKQTLTKKLLTLPIESFTINNESLFCIGGYHCKLKRHMSKTI